MLPSKGPARGQERTQALEVSHQTGAGTWGASSHGGTSEEAAGEAFAETLGAGEVAAPWGEAPREAKGSSKGISASS